MSNGRMTFRFDAGKDKPKELQPESGPDKTKQEQRAEVYSLDEARRTGGGGLKGGGFGPASPWDRMQDREYRLEELEQAYNYKRKTAGLGASHDIGLEEGDPDGARSGGPADDRWDITIIPDREGIAGDPGGPGTGPITEWTPGPSAEGARETDTELLRDAFLRSRPGEDLRAGETEADESYAGFDYGSPSYTAGGGPASGGPRRERTEGPEDGGGYYTTRRNSSWWKFPASVIGAIGIGVLLGYAALTFIGGVDDGGSGGAATPGPASQQNAAGNTASAPAVTVEVAGQSYYLLQYGVFSTPEGAAEARQELANAGLAAGLDPDGGNRVYAGLSPDREQAKLLGNRLKEQGIDLYVKEVSLPPESRLAFGGAGDTVTRYFNTSGQLLSELGSLSASLLGGEPAADTAKVSDLHLQWTEAVKGLEAGLPPEAQAAAKELERSVSRGVSAMNEYSKSKAEGLLWEVQAAMLDMLGGQKRLLAAMEQG
ncbi:hypothetical protein J2Z22_004669 [Paenibacillus forsythiae]|uniref:SPOR domain-containing protein n=1 Tax=Paenibacillus forsythiae TaxID=365616 RepID=A0ABU3HE29_9BACL|nr:SPOR domain-containing protein [Paenibacillus forsythiae]MDT3429070.1 hypothetical protein [Paenibacillus forsythiae]